MNAERFEAATKLADAVLYEGYVLYPYRKSALKNQMRWQFGIIAPRAPDSGEDDWYAQTECIVELPPSSRTTLTVRVRFLQRQTRTVETWNGHQWEPRERVLVEGRELLSWDEAVPCEVVEPDFDLATLLQRRQPVVPFSVLGGREIEEVRDPLGRLVARIVRARQPLSFALRVAACSIEHFVKLTVRVENTSERSLPDDSSRIHTESVHQALIGCHALLGIDGGEFVSALDPKPNADAAVKNCNNTTWWPVLVGPEGSHDLVLCAPMILPDYPAVAPESDGDFFDATEIDAMLTLRVMTLTDLEKQEMAATDDRARRILDRVERSGPGVAQLQGVMRAVRERPADDSAALKWETFVNPPHLLPPEAASCSIGKQRLARGSRVRLTPRGRADAMDMFLYGRVATIAGVFQDLEERIHVAVTLDDDAAADLHRDLGRYFYFSPDELTPLASEADLA